MQFVLESDALQEALKILSRIAPSKDGNVNIESDGKKLFLHSFSDTAKCSINVPAEVSGKSHVFAMSLVALRDATKGRKTLDVIYDKTLCKIKSGNYKIEIATVDAISMDTDDEAKIGKSIKLSVEQSLWLKSAVAVVALKPTVLLTTMMPVAIKLTAKGAFVACYDSNHMAFIQSKEITGEMETRLPLDTLTLVLDVFSKASFKLETSKSSLFVSNALVKVVLALPQEEDNELKLDEVMEAAKGTKQSKGFEVGVSKADLTAFFDNVRAIATKERSELKISTAENKLRLEVTTTNGSSKTVVKCSSDKKASASIDFEYLDEAVRKADSLVSMKLVNDEFLAINLKQGTVVVSLNQE